MRLDTVWFDGPLTPPLHQFATAYGLQATLQGRRSVRFWRDEGEMSGAAVRHLVHHALVHASEVHLGHWAPGEAPATAAWFVRDGEELISHAPDSGGLLGLDLLLPGRPTASQLVVALGQELGLEPEQVFIFRDAEAVLDPPERTVVRCQVLRSEGRFSTHLSVAGPVEIADHLAFATRLGRRLQRPLLCHLLPLREDQLWLVAPKKAAVVVRLDEDAQDAGRFELGAPFLDLWL